MMEFPLSEDQRDLCLTSSIDANNEFCTLAQQLPDSSVTVQNYSYDKGR
jgi:hypothetical protein